MLGAIRYEGFREIYTALHELEPATQLKLREGLLELGTLTRDDAAARFSDYGPTTVAESHHKTAEGFKVRVRANGLVQVEQSLRKTTGLHATYGGLMMTKALLPARAATIEEGARILEAKVVEPLKAAGF